ncbi:MAG: hypothetical protein KF797_13005 [Flavobacteriales bacterium]|nr:hypothetical protein [Flavobacteriales bacterium]
MWPLRSTVAGLACTVAVAVCAQVERIATKVELDEVVITAQKDGFNVEDFILQVMEDTTFHKAFLNTRYHPHRLRSVLRVRAKGEKETASLYRTGHLHRNAEKVWLQIDSVYETGKLRNNDGTLRYLTAEMYDEVFFPKGEIIADNTVASRELELARGSRIDKYKSELKKFMFDPGSEIASVPFIGHKLALFNDDMAPLYDFRIRAGERNGHQCWVFSAEAKPEFRDGRTVIKQMDTWFDHVTNNVIARQYRIAHNSIILDFDIRIRVENAIIDGALVPTLVDYDGDWDIPLKKRELVRFVLEYSGWRIID